MLRNCGLRLRFTSHPVHRADRSRTVETKCDLSGLVAFKFALTTRSANRSAQLGADDAVHGMRSRAQPKVATTQKKAEGESIRWVKLLETRASHSRPMCRGVRELWV